MRRSTTGPAPMSASTAAAAWAIPIGVGATGTSGIRHVRRPGRRHARLQLAGWARPCSASKATSTGAIFAAARARYLRRHHELRDAQRMAGDRARPHRLRLQPRDALSSPAAPPFGNVKATPAGFAGHDARHASAGPLGGGVEVGHRRAVDREGRNISTPISARQLRRAGTCGAWRPTWTSTPTWCVPASIIVSEPTPNVIARSPGPRVSGAFLLA